MPYGSLRPLANVCFWPALPSLPIPRKTSIFPVELSATKRSPFGAVAIRRGSSSPVAYSSTLKPAGAFGQAPSGPGDEIGRIADGLRRVRLGQVPHRDLVGCSRVLVAI